MEWIDTAGRWLIIGLGLSGGLALLVYVWALVLQLAIDMTGVTGKIVDYVRNRHEFRSWKQDRKEWSQEKRKLFQRIRELEKGERVK